MAQKILYFCELCGEEIEEEKRKGISLKAYTAKLNYHPDNKIEYYQNDICPACHKKISLLIKPLAEFLGRRWKDLPEEEGVK